MIKRGVCILSLVLCWMLACPAQASELIRQEQIVAEYDPKIEAAAADYQELTRLLEEKENAELLLMDLMEQWEAAQS